MPSRLQVRRTKGWRKPEGAIYVGRPSRWGNPYRVVNWGAESFVLGPDKVVHYSVNLSKEAAQDLAVRLHRIWLCQQPESWREEARNALRGHDLLCWCRPGDPCHADTLLNLANA